MSAPGLQDLAEAAGLQVQWEDAAGEPQTVSDESLGLILEALGLPSGSPAEIAESRARVREQARAPSSLLTALQGEPTPVALPPGRGRLTLADGGARDIEIMAGELPAIRELGYHRLETGGRETVIAVAPQRAFTMQDAAPGRRAWGVGLQLYSLRDNDSPEFGDFGALAQFARALGAAGADALAISPVHALFAADAGRFSPYGPSSRLYLNGLYARAEAAPGKAAPGELIDWRAGLPAKLARLRQDFDVMTRAGRPAAFDAFCAEGGRGLKDHAVFEALHGFHFPKLGPHGWQAWPRELHDPRSPAVEAFAREHADEVDFHLFLQWRADESLARAQAEALAAGMAVGLIADLAVGMDGGGSHAWSRRGDLLNGLGVGAPPDAFQAEGQEWGIAAFAPAALRATGFEGFIATLRAAMRHSGGLRIDHAMGLKRLWVVPHGLGPKGGAYLSYPFEDLLRLLTLESALNRAVVVAEDLGTVPRGFREALDAHGIMGMRVLWFERTEAGGFIPPQQWSRPAAALSTTHDLPTVAGWWSGVDIDWAVRLDRALAHGTEADEREAREQERAELWETCVAAGTAKEPAPAPESPDPAVDAALGLVASTPCDLAILAAEDLLGAREQPNLPGTMEEHPNWRRRLPAVAAAPFADPKVAARVGAVARLRPKARR